ncbi:MAG: glucose-6-phosphate isomerase [Candidatus Sumerlaeota bacterium]|nr:glucose-6-phosphate isomerase [Candidatus Sumerlaeota bacterium]
MGSKGITYDYSNALASMIGEEHGITEKEIKGLDAKAQAVHKDLQRMRTQKEVGFFDLPYDTNLVKAINAIASDIHRNFENFVVVGIGGSSLGALCLLNALSHNYHNFLDPAGRHNHPRIFFMDNPDPDAVRELLDILDLRTTAFNIISKSGNTSETMAIFMHLYNVVQRRFSKAALSKHFIITTDADRGSLREVAVADKMKTMPIPKNVGGRFSVFSAVGLLPAAVAGINIQELLSGAAVMDERCSKPSLNTNPAYLNAVIHFLAHTKKGKNISVMMPYATALRTVADWYAQSWAESLGKKFDADGNVINTGQTPIKALGAIDQHSQIQLYVEGPNDKIITFIGLGKFSKECRAPKVFHSVPALNYLAENDLEELLSNELHATEFSLFKAQRPSVKFTLDELNARNMGGLLYLFEVQTVFAAGLYNINAFDQPGVQAGKKTTHALMGGELKEDKEELKLFKAYQKEKKSHKCL